MKKILILCAFIALVLGACTVEKRVITARHNAGNIFYVAYFEWEETTIPLLFSWSHDDWSKIKRCNLRDDNTLMCVDEQEAQTILNPQHHGDVDRTSGSPEESAPAVEEAPAEAAPAEEAPAEEAPAEEASAE